MRSPLEILIPDKASVAKTPSGGHRRSDKLTAVLIG